MNDVSVASAGHTKGWAPLALALALALAPLACKKEAGPPAAPPPPEVLATEVEVRDVPIIGHWIGTLDGSVNAHIHAQVAGYLLSQDYREGTLVHKGDLLFQIDPRPFKAALDQAKGRLGQAQAQLGKTELDVKRFTPLAKKGAVSQEELDDAVAARLSARADVEAAQAAVETASLNLGFARITSPVDGIAGLAAAQVGDLVGTGSPDLATVSVVDPIKAIFTVSEQEYLAFRKQFPTQADVEAFRRQSEFELILASGEAYPIKGKSSAAQRSVDVRTGALQVVSLFPNPGNVLRPGMFARVRAQMGLRKEAILVPQRAVMEVQGAYQVAVVDDDSKVHMVKVEAGERVGAQWVIEKGLEAGDRVVVEGLQKVREGTLVRPKPYAAPAAPAAPPAAAQPAPAAAQPAPAAAQPAPAAPPSPAAPASKPAAAGGAG